MRFQNEQVSGIFYILFHSVVTIHHFHIDHNAPCLPSNFAQPLFPIPPGYCSSPKRNRRQWLCVVFVGRGVNKVHYKTTI